MKILNNYWPLIALVLLFLYKWWKSKKILSLLPELKKSGAVFIDVRSTSEFRSANAPGTLNIPLNELKGRLNEIPKTSPVVVCCASGKRSGVARRILVKNGYLDVYNIGSWTKLIGAI